MQNRCNSFYCKVFIISNLRNPYPAPCHSCVKVKKWEFVEINGCSSKFLTWISAPTGLDKQFLPEFRWGMIKVNKKGVIVTSSGSGVLNLKFEYKRHSTLSLIPSFEEGTGKIIKYHISPTRTEKDFVSIIKDTISTAPESCWIFIAD